MHPRPLGCHPKYRMPSRRDNVQAVKSSGAQGYPRSTPPFLGGLGGTQSPEPPFSLVPSTARSLFGGTKRECGVGTVGSGRSHALTDRSKYKACGAVLSTDGKYPKVAGTIAMRPRPTGRRGLRPLLRSSDGSLFLLWTDTVFNQKSTLSGAFSSYYFSFL